MTPSSFIEALVALRFDNTFNPYADLCPAHDKPNAAAVRRKNLQLILDAALTQGVESMWIGRDLGYRGGRRTGLALTDEVHLAAHSKLYGNVELAQATRGPLIGERTAQVIWRVLSAAQHPVFLWNVVPLHPHSPGDPLSNRCHTRTEREASQPLLVWLLDALRPRRIFAIGRDAQGALKSMRITATPVRHPSYGGQRDFIELMSSQYGVATVARTRTANALSS